MAKHKTPDLPAMEGEGVALKRVPSIDKAADEYVDLRDKRMTLLEVEVIAKQKVCTLMEKHGLTQYRYDGHIVELKPGDSKLRVKNLDDEDTDD